MITSSFSLQIEVEERVVKLRGQLLRLSSPSRSGRPAELTKSESPVKTPHGSCASFSAATYDTCSGVWPGVCRAVRTSLPNSKRSPSLHRFRVEAVFRAAFAAEINLRRADAGRKLPRAADEVGVDVRFEDVGDATLCFAGVFQVDLHVGARIDHRRHGRLVVPDQIRKLGDAFGLDAFENK